MAATLSAWRIDRYGPPEVLRPETAPLPTPGPREILIRIRASAVTRADGMMRAGRPRFARLFLGLGRPRQNRSGTGLSGEVWAVGAEVTRFAPGDAIFGEAGMRFGANASHICLEESGVLMPKPDWLSHQDAAVLCDGPLTSWHFLQGLGGLHVGQRVLVLGGAGSLGSAAVQIARAAGAEVSATAGPRNQALLLELGADHAIDYTSRSLETGAARYDVIFDTLGVSSFRAMKGQLAEGGRYLCPVLSLPLLAASLGSRLVGGKRALFAAAGLLPPEVLRGYLGEVLGLLDEGALVPLLDRVYPLSDLVEAHRHMETGHKRGNVVVV
ncbi:NAD(P)-dependent alcohol dehydrogenase [Roseivivax sp.]